LRALNLRGEDCLFADERVQKLVRVREQQRHAVQTAEALIGPVKQLLSRRIDAERRIRWKWSRMERPMTLRSNASLYKPSGAVACK
jgi:Txe/YoeB family toxin of Txe-Axe toxin-antitoxin module